MEPSEPLNNTLCTIHNVSRGCGGGGGGGGETGGVMEKKIELGSQGRNRVGRGVGEATLSACIPAAAASQFGSHSTSGSKT